MKQSAEERIPEDVRDESSGSETKGKGMLGKIRGIKVITEGSTFSAGTHSSYFTERPLRQDPPGT